MADVFTYAVVVDAPDPDVVTRKLTVEVDGAVVSETELGPTGDLGEIKVPQDSKVKLTLVDIDDGGNLSLPLVGEFDIVDKNPPAAPTGFQLNFVSEEEAPAAEGPAT